MNNLKPSVYDCDLIEFKRFVDRSGNISPIEGGKDLPFEMKRIFYLYDIPGGADRGAHAHKNCHQFIIAASGSFDIVLDDGRNKRTVSLNRPYMGLHIRPGIWAAEQSFSSGAICLVFASEQYDENDYIREYKTFVEYVKK